MARKHRSLQARNVLLEELIELDKKQAGSSHITASGVSLAAMH